MLEHNAAIFSDCSQFTAYALLRLSRAWFVVASVMRLGPLVMAQLRAEDRAGGPHLGGSGAALAHRKVMFPY